MGIDIGGNGESAYYFESTPIGTRYQQANSSSRFAPPWTAVVARTPVGWNAILIIPLSDLQIASGGAKHWRVNFVRSVASTSQHLSYAFSPIRIYADMLKGSDHGTSEFGVGFISIGPQYNPQIGYTTIADVRGPEAVVAFIRNVKAGPIKSLQLTAEGDRWIDSLGYAHLNDAFFGFTVITKDAMRFNYSNSNSSQRSYDGNSFTGGFNNYANRDHPVSQ